MVRSTGPKSMVSRFAALAARRRRRRKTTRRVRRRPTRRPGKKPARMARAEKEEVGVEFWVVDVEDGGLVDEGVEALALALVGAAAVDASIAQLLPF